MYLRLEVRGHYIEAGRIPASDSPQVIDHPTPLVEYVGFLPPDAPHIRTNPEDDDE